MLERPLRCGRFDSILVRLKAFRLRRAKCDRNRVSIPYWFD